MPRRPRNHEIATETRRAFEHAVPPSWVVRPVDGDDYGLDREVEIFENNAATGLTFKVQLKGTDGSGSALSGWCQRSPRVRRSAAATTVV